MKSEYTASSTPVPTQIDQRSMDDSSKTLLTVGDLGVMMRFPNQLYHFPICAICASLHSVTLLIYLNSRSYITLSTDSKATWKQSIHFAQPGGSGSSSELSSEAITELYQIKFTLRSSKLCLKWIQNFKFM
ncbi:hypothetical protein D9757_010479 [Collybiopsis confluens]|uniref:Uncharacterized protein n=1 Tax=Collybiopsis confluens TaxID=2823264 RepID=A0A8H5GZ75_9AGAR|nr:hypothetical protein D9757_010479 [Collybiopsis confluens]